MDNAPPKSLYFIHARVIDLKITGKRELASWNRVRPFFLREYYRRFF